MEQLTIKNITGFNKKLFNIRLKISCFLYFSWRLILGDIKLKFFFRFFKRLLFFLFKMQHNKFVRIGKQTKINLYVPGFPSKAFYTACRKVLEFDKKMPDVTVLLSVTSACRYKCEHCYQKYDLGKDVDIDVLINVIKKLQDKGVAFFNVEGGEPFIVFDRLKKVCEAIDDRSEILINSTGDGMTYEKLFELKKHKNLLGIMFSLHTYEPEELNRFMGVHNAWDNLINGIQLCHQVGIPVTFNTCLQSGAFYDGTFEKIMEVAKDFKGDILQLIKPKPAGGWLESGASNFSDQDMEHIKKIVRDYNLSKEYKNYTFISCMLIEEDKSLFGCTAGATDRFYINAKGDLQPCEFLNISFGNIRTDDFNTIYNNMREWFREPGDCWLCEKYSADIYKLYKDNNLKALPLPPELSKKIYEKWDRGEISKFYREIGEI
ncbi:MAG: radical SAM protein [Bacteroidia bacterium]|nr:radical SAM protein [Bacteroidia bacterium]